MSPFTMVILAGAICAATLDYGWVSLAALLSALANEALRVWASRQ